MLPVTPQCQVPSAPVEHPEVGPHAQPTCLGEIFTGVMALISENVQFGLFYPFPYPSILQTLGASPRSMRFYSSIKADYCYHSRTECHTITISPNIITQVFVIIASKKTVTILPSYLVEILTTGILTVDLST